MRRTFPLVPILLGIPLFAFATGDNTFAGSVSQGSFDVGFWIQVATLIVLTITAIAVIVYTIETKKLRIETQGLRVTSEEARKESARISEIELHPWLVGSSLHINEESDPDPGAIYLPMENKGKTPAYDINFHGKYFIHDRAIGFVSQSAGFLAPGDFIHFKIMAKSDIPEEGRGGRIIVTVTYTAHPNGSGVIKQGFAKGPEGWSNKDSDYTVTLSTGEKLSKSTEEK